MPETPERDIEKQLRQHAEERRAAAGEPSLHPANRRVLQAEVRRHWGGRNLRHPERNWRRRFWPRLAFALGAVAVLGTTAILMFGPEEKAPLHLAKLEEPAPSVSAMPMTAPAAAPVVSSDSRKEAKAASPSPPENLSAASGGELFANPMGGYASTPAAPAPTREFSASETLAAKTMAPVAEGQFFGGTMLAKKDVTATVDGRMKDFAATSDTLTMDTSATLPQSSALALADKQVAGVTQYFRNAAIPEGAITKGVEVLPVLNNFSVAQNGNELTVVDEDGSVYNGTVQLAPPAIVSGRTDLAEADRAGGLPATRLAAKDDVARRSVAVNLPAESNTITVGRDLNQAGIAGEPLNWQFKVEGTNRSLQQRVVFTGNLIQNAVTPTEDRSRQMNYQQVPAAQNQFYNYNQNRSGQQNNFINGRVILNDRKETELNALSVEPK